jgi:putative membrane protein (TIGR04086 family)
MNGDEDGIPFVKILKCSLFGLLAMLISGLLLITVTAAIAFACPDPASLTAPLSLLSLMLSELVGGFVCSKLSKGHPLVCGLVCGAVCALCMLLLSPITFGAPSSEYGFWQGALLHLYAVGFSLIGSYLGNIKLGRGKPRKRFGR